MTKYYYFVSGTSISGGEFRVQFALHDTIESFKQIEHIENRLKKDLGLVNPIVTDYKLLRVERDGFYEGDNDEISQAFHEGYILGKEEAEKKHMEICKKFFSENPSVDLPCNVGDTVYVIPTAENSFCEIVKMKCIGFTIGEWNTATLIDKKKKMYNPSFDMFGESVFLSREDAEKGCLGND